MSCLLCETSQVAAVHLGRLCQGLQHFHRGVHPQPTGTHRPGDRSAHQTHQSSAGTPLYPVARIN